MKTTIPLDSIATYLAPLAEQGRLTALYEFYQLYEDPRVMRWLEEAAAFHVRKRDLSPVRGHVPIEMIAPLFAHEKTEIVGIIMGSFRFFSGPAARS